MPAAAAGRAVRRVRGLTLLPSWTVPDALPATTDLDGATAAIDTFGRLDILINKAGVGAPGAGPARDTGPVPPGGGRQPPWHLSEDPSSPRNVKAHMEGSVGTAARPRLPPESGRPTAGYCTLKRMNTRIARVCNNSEFNSPLGHKIMLLTSGFLAVSTIPGRACPGHRRGGSSTTGTCPLGRTRVLRGRFSAVRSRTSCSIS
jgi:hypothetical protein